MQVADLYAKLGLRPDKASFKQGDKLLNGIKTALGAIVAFKTVKWFGSLVTDTIEASSKFVDLSQKIGIAIEPLQQLEYAAEQSGATIDSLSAGLGKFSMFLAGAAKGSKENKKTLKGLGISAKDALGGLRPMEDVLGDVAERFANMPDGPLKTAKAMELFGRGGKDLVPLLNEGREGVSKLRKEFVALGGQIESKDAVAMESLGDDFNRLKVTAKGLRNQFAVALLPTIQRVMSSVLEWVKANRELIATKVRAFANGLVNAAKALWPIIKQVVSVGVAAVKWLVDLNRVTGNAIPLMFAVVKAFGLVKNVISGIGAVLTGHPLFLLVGLGIAIAAAFGVEPLEAFKAVLGTISTMAQDLMQTFKDLAASLGIEFESPAAKALALEKQFKGVTDEQLKKQVGNRGRTLGEDNFALDELERRERHAKFDAQVKSARAGNTAGLSDEGARLVAMREMGIDPEAPQQATTRPSLAAHSSRFGESFGEAAQRVSAIGSGKGQSVTVGAPQLVFNLSGGDPALIGRIAATAVKEVLDTKAREIANQGI